MRLSELRNGAPLSTKAAAHYARGQLAAALRKRPYQTNLLIAGHDATGPSLYWVDYLATMHPMNVAGTGYGSYFALAMLDRLWRPDLTLADAVGLMDKAIEEVRKRLVVAPSAFVVKVVDKDGARVVKTVRPAEEGGGGGAGGGGVPVVGVAG